MSKPVGTKSYTDAKKIECVTAYLALGKAPLVEVVTGVPRQTIRAWKLTQWWKDIESEIRSDDDAELDSRLSKIINRTLDTVVDRIDNGDFVLDSRSGTVKRVPVKMREAHKVGVELMDKRNLIRGKPTQIIQKVTIDDVMAKLATEFAEWSKGLKRPNERVIEHDVETLPSSTSEVPRIGLGESSNSHSETEERELPPLEHQA